MNTILKSLVAAAVAATAVFGPIVLTGSAAAAGTTGTTAATACESGQENCTASDPWDA
ncbi:hypothetical protein [Nocardiopsis sp. CC223A]|uniref:hypothetical protein n=1 Tax=Nocardiopsis sp. CC223A TaxID=3044051 RepID=UPI00278C6CBB|nr:hypothetical protein [Nocardiopsis sp. CC223A]